MNKIQKLSRFFKIFLQLAMVGTILTPIYIWLTMPLHITNDLISNGMTKLAGFVQFKPFIKETQQIFYPFTLPHKLLGLLVDTIPTAINIMVLFYLYKAFSNFEQNLIFAVANVNLIRKAAIWLLIGQALVPLYSALMSFCMTIFNPPHHRLIAISIHSNNISVILLALAILLISWVMLEAVKLRDENQAFV